jgi:hypothetical protein
MVRFQNGISNEEIPSEEVNPGIVVTVENSSQEDRECTDWQTL